MITFYEIPKNASRYANLLTNSLKTNENVNVCFLRDPYQRFWDAVKTIIPSISFYGSYPPNGTKIITEYAPLNINYQDAISQALALLGQPQYIHLATQSSFIGTQKFDEVFLVDENLIANCQSLVAKYNLTLIENFNINQFVNQSPTDIDTTVMSYINETPAIQQQLQTFYANDIALLENINSIKNNN